MFLQRVCLFKELQDRLDTLVLECPERLRLFEFDGGWGLLVLRILGQVVDLVAEHVVKIFEQLDLLEI